MPIAANYIKAIFWICFFFFNLHLLIGSLVQQIRVRIRWRELCFKNTKKEDASHSWSLKGNSVSQTIFRAVKSDKRVASEAFVGTERTWCLNGWPDTAVRSLSLIKMIALRLTMPLFLVRPQGIMKKRGLNSVMYSSLLPATIVFA